MRFLAACRYNRRMGKAKADENDDHTTTADRQADDTAESAETDNESDSDADSLKPVKTKIGEAKDNLRQRSDWFQRRR